MYPSLKKYPFLLLAILMSCKSDEKENKATFEVPHSFQDISAKVATKFEPQKISKEGSPEFGITFTKDMDTLFFTSKREGDKNFFIYTSTYTNGAWKKPKIAEFSGKYLDADAFLDSSGKRLFFFSMRPVDNDTMPLQKPNIWYTERDGISWADPKLVEGAINSNSSGEGYMSLTNKNTIYFSSVGRLEGKQHDIYNSKYSEGLYTEPEHIELNIEKTFSNPYISIDEEFLIVDSEQSGGFGQNDLYYFKRSNENNSWSEGTNMGSVINTNGDEGTPSISPDGKWFFFSRDGDLYFVDSRVAFRNLH